MIIKLTDLHCVQGLSDRSGKWLSRDPDPCGFQNGTFSYGGLGRDSAKQAYFCFPTAIQGPLGNTTRYYNEINIMSLYYAFIFLYSCSTQLHAYFKLRTLKD